MAIRAGAWNPAKQSRIVGSSKTPVVPRSRRILLLGEKAVLSVGTKHAMLMIEALANQLRVVVVSLCESEIKNKKIGRGFTSIEQKSAFD